MRDAKRDVYKDVLINACSKYNKEMTFSLSLSLFVYPPLIINLSLSLSPSARVCFVFYFFVIYLICFKKLSIKNNTVIICL
jgi:hypothetical protein